MGVDTAGTGDVGRAAEGGRRRPRRRIHGAGWLARTAGGYEASGDLRALPLRVTGALGSTKYKVQGTKLNPKKELQLFDPT